jgi:hypothetical protein
MNTINELQSKIESQQMLLAEQLLIIKGFTLECETMGTTDIIRALDRKDEQIICYEVALEKIARLGNEPEYGNSVGNLMAKMALEKYR